VVQDHSAIVAVTGDNRTTHHQHPGGQKTVGHVISDQVVRVALLPEAPLHHRTRTRSGATFPGGRPGEVLGVQRRGWHETCAGSAASVSRATADAFLHLVIAFLFFYRCVISV
jgi:hypothetical protein